jgi:hypothetical protein
MHDGILALPGFVVLLKDILRIGSVQHRGNVVNHHLHVFGQVALRNKAEHIAQDTDCFRDEVVRQLAVKAVAAPCSCGKQTAGYGLRKEVGKILFLQVSDEEFPEGFIKAVQFTFTLLPLITFENRLLYFRKNDS